MQVGMIGLGRMGTNMVRRLTRGGHACVVYDRWQDAVQALGGEPDAVQRLEPLLATLVHRGRHDPEDSGSEGGTAQLGYLHCGPNDAGHFVKMVHNGIEYGLMAAYAEGLNILRHADVGKRPRKADAETAPLRNPEYYRCDFDLSAMRFEFGGHVEKGSGT